jgi:hypothetical protein
LHLVTPSVAAVPRIAWSSISVDPLLADCQ